MDYQTVSQFITAPHIYANITDEQLNAMPVSYYMTVLNGVRYVGTYDAVDVLASQELIPAPQPEAPTTDATTTSTTGTDSSSTTAPTA
jgi:hypothetical protein